MTTPESALVERDELTLPGAIRNALECLCDAIRDMQAEVERQDAALRNIRAIAEKRLNEGGPDGNLSAVLGFARAALLDGE